MVYDVPRRIATVQWKWCGMYKDRNGRSTLGVEWSKLFDDPCYRIVAKNTVRGVVVSTVWIGLSNGGTFFETILDHEFVASYCSEEDALFGHELVCRVITAIRRDVESWVLL